MWRIWATARLRKLMRADMGRDSLVLTGVHGVWHLTKVVIFTCRVWVTIRWRNSIPVDWGPLLPARVYRSLRVLPSIAAATSTWRILATARLRNTIQMATE